MGIFSLTCLITASACTDNTGSSDPSTPEVVTTTVTPAATNSEAPDPTTASSTPSTGTPGVQDYSRVDQSVYDIGLADAESAVFTSGDGSVHCSFTAEHGMYNYPRRLFAIDETVGNCIQGAETVSVNTNAAEQSDFAAVSGAESPDLPVASATLDTGEFVHLGKMACFAPGAAEISCTRFTTGEAFNIEAEGFRELSAPELQAQLTDAQGYTQVLSRVIELPLNGTEGIRCFYDRVNEGGYSCMTLSTAWEPTTGGGSANMLSWQLQEGTAEFEKAFAANPGFDVYESRQLLDPGQYRLDEGMVADYDGTQVIFTTAAGDSFWINGPEYGTESG